MIDGKNFQIFVGLVKKNWKTLLIFLALINILKKSKF